MIETMWLLCINLTQFKLARFTLTIKNIFFLSIVTLQSMYKHWHSFIGLNDPDYSLSLAFSYLALSGLSSVSFSLFISLKYSVVNRSTSHFVLR